MSTILKALKKLDEEKRAADAPVDLPRKILADPVQARRKSKPVMWICAGILAGALFAVLTATGLFWWKEPPARIMAPGETPFVATMPGVATTMSPTSVPQPGNGSGSSPPPRVGQSGMVGSPLSDNVIPRKILPPPTARLASVVKEASGLNVKQETQQQTPVEQVQVSRHEIPAPGQQWTAPHLTVSDIMPASSGGRMAIVNGLPVMEGTMVDDAVVREIRSGQVVFEIDGKNVAVPLAARP